MEDKVAQAIADSFRTVCGDDAWQILGFRRRPRGGSLFQMLRPQWRVDLKNTVLREMTFLVTAAYIAADVIKADEIEAVANYCTSTPELSRALGYQSQDKGEAHIFTSLQTYANESPERWPALFFSRINPSAVPDKKLAARLVLGCARFAALARDMIHTIKKAT